MHARHFPSIRGAVIHSDRGEPVYKRILQVGANPLWDHTKYEQ